MENICEKGKKNMYLPMNEPVWVNNRSNSNNQSVENEIAVVLQQFDYFDLISKNVLWTEIRFMSLGKSRWPLEYTFRLCDLYYLIGNF